MANISITKQGDVLIVDFGIYSALPTVGTKKRTVQRRFLGFMTEPDNNNVLIAVAGNPSFRLVHAANPDVPDGMVVDSVEGIAPTDNDHLFTLLLNALTL